MKKSGMTAANWSKKLEFIGLLIDILMIVIVIANLIFVIFDWFFEYSFFQKIVQAFSYDFYLYYKVIIHPDFLLYDSFFITIFVSELLISWLISIILKTYARWWLYPIMHWYDVIGCIPLGPFIWLRLLRIISIELRLNKMGVIHLRRTYFYKEFYGAYEIFVQELTDRVMVRAIESLQRGVTGEKTENKDDNEIQVNKSQTDIATEGDLQEKDSIFADAIKPDQEELARIIAVMVHQAAVDNYARHGQEILLQVRQIIHDAFEHTEEFNKLKKVPIVGHKITQKLEDSISDILSQVVNSSLKKLASDQFAQLVEGVINTTLEAMESKNIRYKTKTGSEEELHIILRDIVDRILEKVKENLEGESKKVRRIQEPEEIIIKVKI